MTIRMASPLYIVRQDCEKDLFAVLRRLAEAGFDGIEFLGFKLEHVEVLAMYSGVPVWYVLSD